MPNMPILALRYLAWLIGLRVVFGVLVQVAGLPNSMATGVILAAAPLADIGYQAVRRATRVLAFADWALVWGMCLGIFVVVQVILPAILLAPMRAVMADPAGLQQTVVVLLSTAAMMVVFLWIGQRSVRGPGR
jgi:amino acid permease